MQKYNKQKFQRLIIDPPSPEFRRKNIHVTNNNIMMRTNNQKFEIEIPSSFSKPKTSSKYQREDLFPKLEPERKRDNYSEVKPKQIQMMTILVNEQQQHLRKIDQKNIKSNQKRKNYDDYIQENKKKIFYRGNRFISTHDKLDQYLISSPYIQDNTKILSQENFAEQNLKKSTTKKQKPTNFEDLKYEARKNQTLNITLLGLKKQILNNKSEFNPLRTISKISEMCLTKKNPFRKLIIKPIELASKEVSKEVSINMQEIENQPFAPWYIHEQQII